MILFWFLGFCEYTNIRIYVIYITILNIDLFLLFSSSVF